MARRLTTNAKLLIVLGVLGGAAAVKVLVGGRAYETGESAQASDVMFQEVKREDLSAVLIEAPEGKRHELVKDGGHWTVASEGNARADQNDVNKVLDAVTRLKKGRIISTRGENLSRFGLDDAKATRVTAWGKAGRSAPPVASFAIGKDPGDWKNAFVKLPAESAVRKVEGSVSDYEPGTDNTWRDKTMFDHGPADQIAQFRIAGPKGTLVLARDKVMGPKEPAHGATDAAGGDSAESEGEATPAAEGELEVKETFWKFVAPEEGQRAKKWLCDSIAGYVAKLECDAFGTAEDQPAEIGLDPPHHVISVQREGETEWKEVLHLGSKNQDGKYAARLPGPEATQVWWIASWKGDYLTKTVEDLLETPPAKPAPVDGEEPEEPEAPAPDEAKPAEEASGDGEADPKEPAREDGDASAEPASPPKDGGAPAGPPPDDGA